MNVVEIRESGKGSNFTVVNQKDGYRQDDRLWFGQCSVCGETVTNSALKGIWEHHIVLSETLDANGIVTHHSSKSSDICPKA